ncbi:MAG: SIS domain-containing protein [candidate division Zixibacteria bacterium]|nr:SIS domain-containing protein [candidate division Zixibacteria bacterium]
MSDKEREMVMDALTEREKLLLAAKNDYPDKVVSLATTIARTIADGGKVLVCGNGGSAAESQHFAAEMVVRLTEKHERAPLPTMALTTDSSVLTACANDYGFERVFSRQVEALGRKGDLLLVLSTSGNSGNLISAVTTARDLPMETVALLGKGGGELAEIANFSIIIPSQSVLRIQEEHLYILHQLVELVQDSLSPEV